ncbi:MAG: hypothetical protein HOJ35_02955 [Bdellovibrionales bacterium]|nr:hypothetical protein [Bdellovibrionales bacterium]
MRLINTIKLFSLLGVITIFVLASARATEGIDYSNFSPGASAFDRPFFEKSQGYQIKMIGKKFATVATETGMPVAVFDLTLNHLTFTQIVLGGFKITDLGLKGVLKHRKCAKKAKKENRKFNNGKKTKDINLDKCSAKSSRTANKFWDNLKMNESWAIKNEQLLSGNNLDGYKFTHSDFNLSELNLSGPEETKEITEPFIKLANILYPNSSWNESNILEFMKEFEMKFHKKDQKYDLVWNREVREKKKGPKLPGFVVNYLNPAANVIYRNKLMQIDQLADLVKYRFWPYGSLVTMFVYRVVDKLVDRLNYHESQFISLMEASRRFEYDLILPHELNELTLDLVYLGRSKPTHYRSGAEYRKKIKAYQEISKLKVLKRLEKKSKKQDFNYQLAGGGRFVVARNKDDNTFKGIYSAGIKPHLLTKQISMHVNAKTPAFKITERLVTDAAGLLAKTFVKTYFRVPIPKINFIIQVPRDTWDRLVRGRMKKEINMEGELVGLVDESLNGKIDLGLDKDELQLVRKRLRSVYLNPYEVSLNEEEAVINKNLELLKKAISEGNPKEIFSSKSMVPFVL